LGWFYSQLFDLNIQLGMKFHTPLSIGGQLHEIGDSTHEVELLLHHNDVESDGNWVENYPKLSAPPREVYKAQLVNLHGLIDPDESLWLYWPSLYRSCPHSSV
jgi:hypothetical protein